MQSNNDAGTPILPYFPHNVPNPWVRRQQTLLLTIAPLHSRPLLQKCRRLKEPLAACLSARLFEMRYKVSQRKTSSLSWASILFNRPKKIPIELATLLLLCYLFLDFAILFEHCRCLLARKRTQSLVVLDQSISDRFEGKVTLLQTAEQVSKESNSLSGEPLILDYKAEFFALPCLVHIYLSQSSFWTILLEPQRLCNQDADQTFCM